MKILHLYVDKALGWEHCKKTFEIVAELKDEFGIESVYLDENDDYAYWKALMSVWAQDDLLTIEQDLIFTREQLNEILKCKHKDCTFAFKLYPVTTALPYIVWSIGENLLPSQIRLFREEEKPKFCNFTSLGFTKLSLETQVRTPLDLTPWHWKFVDIGTIGKLKDLKVHVHYGVEHAHKE